MGGPYATISLAGCVNRSFSGRKNSLLAVTRYGESLQGGAVPVYAIIETGGKQYKVKEGDILDVEKLGAAEGETVEVTQVLAVGPEGDLQVGRPYVAGAKVILRIEKQAKGEKVIVFKYKPKKRYRKKQGHRQPLSRVVVEKIEV